MDAVRDAWAFVERSPWWAAGWLLGSLLLAHVIATALRIWQSSRIGQKLEELDAVASATRAARADRAAEERAVPVTILTGFLGAGKTTLLNRLLREAGAARKRVCVIENEAGPVSIDHMLLAGAARTEDDVFVLENGCMCCSTGSVGNELERVLDRVSAMLRLGGARVDHVVVECSGLVDPGPIVDVFFRREALRLASVVALADAAHVGLHLGVRSRLDRDPGSGASPSPHRLLFAPVRAREASRQIAYADVVLVNKCDLVEDPSMRDQVVHAVQALNPTASVYLCALSSEAPWPPARERATHPPLPTLGADQPLFDLLLPSSGAAARKRLAPPALAPDVDHAHTAGVSAVTIPLDRPLARDTLRSALRLVARDLWPHLFRLKGWVDLTDGARAWVQGVHGEIHVEESEQREPRGSREAERHHHDHDDHCLDPHCRQDHPHEHHERHKDHAHEHGVLVLIGTDMENVRRSLLQALAS